MIEDRCNVLLVAYGHVMQVLDFQVLYLLKDHFPESEKNLGVYYTHAPLHS
jgi:hypothetical protein